MTSIPLPPRKSIYMSALVDLGCPVRFCNARLEDYDMPPKLSSVLFNYVNNINAMFNDGVGLTLYGNNGNGKTLISSIILREVYRLRYTVRRITLTDFINLKFSDETKYNEYKELDFLIIDEVGKEIFGDKGFNITEFESILRLRETFSLPTIICSNLDSERIKEQYGESIYSVLRGSSMFIKFSMEDFRKSSIQESKAYKILKGIPHEEREL